MEAIAESCKVDDAALDGFLNSLTADDDQEDEEDEEDEDVHHDGADFQDCDNDTRRFTLDVDDTE